MGELVENGPDSLVLNAVSVSCLRERVTTTIYNPITTMSSPSELRQRAPPKPASQPPPPDSPAKPEDAGFLEMIFGILVVSVVVLIVIAIFASAVFVFAFYSLPYLSTVLQKFLFINHTVSCSTKYVFLTIVYTPETFLGIFTANLLVLAYVGHRHLRAGGNIIRKRTEFLEMYEKVWEEEILSLLVMLQENVERDAMLKDEEEKSLDKEAESPRVPNPGAEEETKTSDLEQEFEIMDEKELKNQ